MWRWLLDCRIEKARQTQKSLQKGLKGIEPSLQLTSSLIEFSWKKQTENGGHRTGWHPTPGYLQTLKSIQRIRFFKMFLFLTHIFFTSLPELRWLLLYELIGFLLFISMCVFMAVSWALLLWLSNVPWNQIWCDPQTVLLSGRLSLAFVLPYKS